MELDESDEAMGQDIGLCTDDHTYHREGLAVQQLQVAASRLLGAGTRGGSNQYISRTPVSEARRCIVTPSKPCTVPTRAKAPRPTSKRLLRMAQRERRCSTQSWTHPRRRQSLARSLHLRHLREPAHSPGLDGTLPLYMPSERHRAFRAANPDPHCWHQEPAARPRPDRGRMLIPTKRTHRQSRTTREAKARTEGAR